MNTLRWLTSRVLELAACIVPMKSHVVIHGFPADEGNVVEVVAALNSRYAGRIFWLVDERDGWLVDPALKKVAVLPKLSFRAMYLYVTAEAVFFTHGLYGDTRPRRGRTFVNLWHGDGFKIKKDAEASKRSLYPAQFTVGCTTLLTARRARDFKMSEDSILRVGNPRMDQFYMPLSNETRTKIGLPADKKFVVWVPTFRANHGAGVTKGWSDVGHDAPNPNELMLAVTSELSRQGFTVIVKPHPQDRESRAVPDTIVLDNADLNDAGTTFYTLLGAAAGIITDYSSVWTEYLALDRPIGFVVPDRQQYSETRGLYPSDLFEWLPGPILENGGSAVDFVYQLTVDEMAAGRKARKKAAELLGLGHGAGNTTNHLLDVLEEKGAFSKAGTLIASRDRTVGSHAVMQRVSR